MDLDGAGVTAKGHCSGMVFYSRNERGQVPAAPNSLPTHSEHLSGALLCLCFCRGSPCLPPKGVQACRSLQLHPSAQWTVKWSWQRCWLRADERANEGLHQEGNFPHLHYYMWKCHSDQSNKCSGGKGNIMTETIWHPI